MQVPFLYWDIRGGVEKDERMNIALCNAETTGAIFFSEFYTNMYMVG